MLQVEFQHDLDDWACPNVPNTALLAAYDAATADCRHESLFTVWDEPVVVLLCEGCGTVFTGDVDYMESELVRPFAEALERR